ncbi:MAG: glutamate-cysteine ligase family protein [Candidatus Hodarchaeales archaeon]|jgi:hypothetical protein
MAEKSYLPQTELFFTHGIEIENHLVSRESGEVLVGDPLLTIWEQMFYGAFDYLNRIKKDKKTPKYIANKIAKVEIREEEKRERRLSFIFLHYKLGKKTLKINCFGPDPNISQITWLLELVTPPCQYLEEIAFWIDKLYEAAIHGLSKTEVALLPMGLNPMEKRVRSGLTCGEHHHIGVPSFFRAPVYNLIRNYIPHLIAFSSTSPFLDQKPSKEVIIKEKDGKSNIIGRCIHSYRLLNNTGQMGPNIPQYLPPIDDLMDGEDFAKLVKKGPPDHRMVDMFPYTDYSTIELRFFDAQPWYENRLAIVLLIQAIAQKAKNMIGEKKEIHNVSANSLYKNRRKAVQFGFLAQFSPDDDLHPDFARYYNFDSLTGKKASKLIHSANSLVLFIQNELESLGTDYLDYILIPLLGTKQFNPPLAVTDYLLSRYDPSKSLSDILPELYYNDQLRYPLALDGNILLEFVDVDAIELEKRESVLQQALRTDIEKRNISSTIPIEKKKKVVSKTRKKKTEKPIRKAKRPTKIVKPKPTPTKKDVKVIEKPLLKEKPITETKPKPVKIKEVSEKIKTPPTRERPVTTARPKQETKVISAFEKTDDLEVFAHTIDIEPKYRKIESKIAKVMKTRRKEIEARRLVFFKEHLEEERKPFKYIKKVKAIFPSVVSGKDVFGYIEISFSNISTTLYKFRNNPITFIFTAKASKVAMLEKKGMNKIPFSIELGNLEGEIQIGVEAITATNESLLPDNFSFKIIRKDSIKIEAKEFYITSNYGPVECVYRGLNQFSKAKKGEIHLFLVSQSLKEPISIQKTKFNLKTREYLELARSIDLDVNFQHCPFYIVSSVSMKKNRSFKTIRVPQLNKILVDWNFTVDPSKRTNLWEGVSPNTKYEIDFVFQFLDILPPLNIEIFVNVFPTGERKRLSVLQIKREIDKGDEVVAENISFKTPKNCQYLFLDAVIRTEKGLIPVDLISEPIGIQERGTQLSTFEERYDLTL